MKWRVLLINILFLYKTESIKSVIIMLICLILFAFDFNIFALVIFMIHSYTLKQIPKERKMKL